VHNVGNIHNIETRNNVGNMYYKMSPDNGICGSANLTYSIYKNDMMVSEQENDQTNALQLKFVDVKYRKCVLCVDSNSHNDSLESKLERTRIDENNSKNKTFNITEQDNWDNIIKKINSTNNVIYSLISVPKSIHNVEENTFYLDSTDVPAATGLFIRYSDVDVTVVDDIIRLFEVAENIQIQVIKSSFKIPPKVNNDVVADLGITSTPMKILEYSKLIRSRLFWVYVIRRLKFNNDLFFNLIQWTPEQLELVKNPTKWVLPISVSFKSDSHMHFTLKHIDDEMNDISTMILKYFMDTAWVVDKNGRSAVKSCISGQKFVRFLSEIQKMYFEDKVNIIDVLFGIARN
jgi:hypothetical protein